MTASRDHVVVVSSSIHQNYVSFKTDYRSEGTTIPVYTAVGVLPRLSKSSAKKWCIKYNVVSRVPAGRIVLSQSQVVIKIMAKGGSG